MAITHSDQPGVHTNGGAYIGGSVTAGGDVVMGNQTNTTCCSVATCPDRAVPPPTGMTVNEKNSFRAVL